MTFGEDRQTRVGIDGEDFTINGEPTLEGRRFEGRSIEGLLPNARMVQALFDDENPETRGRWAYPDTGEWDPERNVAEFVEALPTYYDHGLRAVTVNLQCGNPNGYSPEHPQVVSAYRPDGSLKAAWLDRLARVLDATDELGMAVILGLFYQGQDDHLEDDDAVRAGVDNVVDWLGAREYTNVLIEVNNECDATPESGWGYERAVLKPGRVHELIERIRAAGPADHSYPVSTSFTGGTVPSDNVVAASDYLLVHGNGVTDPWKLGEVIDAARSRPSYEPMPVVVNEDDHYGFDSHPNNMLVAFARGASWGYYDAGRNDYRHGFQSPPVDWTLSTDRKRAFFEYLRYAVHESPG